MEKTMGKIIGKQADLLRRLLLACAGNVSLFITVTFFVTSLLVLGPQFWWREHIDMLEQYVIIPWGMALCLLRLERRAKRPDSAVRLDLTVLFVLLVWIIVPFAIRFGNTFNNSGSWHNHIVLFFGIYATIVETDAQGRECLLDLAGVLFALASFVLGIALLYCVVTVQSFGDFEFAFGIVNGKYLSAYTHYNTTAMVAMCCTMMSLSAFCRQKAMPVRMLCLASVVMMSLVIILTQSRTSRYVLVITYAAGAYGLLSSRAKPGRALVRHAAALAAALVVAVGGYIAADAISDAAIAHYNHVRLMEQEREEQLAAQEKAQEAAAEKTAKTEKAEGSKQKASSAEEKKETKTKTVVTARPALNASLSGRVDIWENLFTRWKENPKYLLIGHGISRVGQLMTEDTIHEGRDAVSIHNAYLQYTADYGLIGFGLLFVFLLLMVPQALRVFFARGALQIPGYRALCMLVIACLMIGMLESATLNVMTPVNMMLFYALALLCARGRDIAPCKAR